MIDWEDTIRCEGPALWRSIYRLVQNRTDADECLQETFVAAVKLSQRQAVQNWPTLLKHLAVARAVDCLRKRMRRARIEDVHDIDVVPAVGRSPADRAENAELARVLRWALAQVPVRSAEALCLYELEDWTYEAIGEHLSISSGAVGMLLARARRRLQKLLAKTWERQA
ncbi:MAG TPA: RNA polymerase sigma factor [Pirellulales bacterium]|jgi:RNA polymerase sigma-70 factor (ECF subfamily)